MMAGDTSSGNKDTMRGVEREGSLKRCHLSRKLGDKQRRWRGNDGVKGVTCPKVLSQECTGYTQRDAKRIMWLQRNSQYSDRRLGHRNGQQSC